ncbi:MAG: hypothetical protein AB1832_10865 [Pseudomonadota bacterium]
MATDLTTDEGLRQACESARAKRSPESHANWTAKLSRHLSRVREVSHDEFLTPAFQQYLWEDESISATGMGHVDVSEIIKSAEIAELLWNTKRLALPSDPGLRGKALASAWNELLALIGKTGGRIPWLKMYRVFAALHPRDFTTIAHHKKLQQLARKMGISKVVEHPLMLHRHVLDRLDIALGSADGSDVQWLERMTLPWDLYVTHVQDQGDEATSVAGPVAGEEVLKPLPADRRRRGMLAIGGSLPTVRAMIEFAKEGCKREDFHDHILSINPKLAPRSVGTNINALIAEWGVLKASGDELSLTPRGEAFLETGDPEEVADWLLTRILGFDNALYLLRDGPRPQKQLILDLQQVNPGWTSSFAPTAMINWIKAMDLAELTKPGILELTERGREWANKIHWSPGTLPPLETVKPSTKAPNDAASQASEEAPDSTYAKPSLKEIVGTFPTSVLFNDTLVGRLDAGLWSHQRRHFAVLTGLSGAGKTLLACSYARGLWSKEPDSANDKGLLVVPVQPGWHDPASLLGFVNPLESQTYVRTPFLDFLLEASLDPDRPYTAILDEMNLSHPEQYLAPLLSAMETGKEIELHAQGDEVDGIPARIAYPSNLLLIGTVNMDETTHGLSDKVLDRASVIEFWDIDISQYPSWAKSGLKEEQVHRIQATLQQLMEALRPVRLHFGWRTIDDVLGYIRAALDGGFIGFDEAFDHAVYSKILPKLRGEDTPRLQHAFRSVQKILSDASLPHAGDKVRELLDDLTHLGSARFWR